MLIIAARLGGALPAGHVNFYAHSQWTHMHINTVMNWLTGFGYFQVPLACGIVVIEGNDCFILNTSYVHVICWDSQPLLTNKQVM